MSETAPTVPWIVSSRVRPVNTRIVRVCSSWVSVFHDWMSFDSGTFSGSQKLFTRRFHTSTSLSSWILFQLIASTCETSLSLSGVMGFSSFETDASGRVVREGCGLDTRRLRRRYSTSGEVVTDAAPRGTASVTEVLQRAGDA